MTRTAALADPVPVARTAAAPADGPAGGPADRDLDGHPAGPPRGDGPRGDGPRAGFHVRLENFDGPFDLLLQLISAQRMDVTEIALHRVTDDFIRHIRAAGPDFDLGEATEFLVVAATLLDLKAARLLPSADDDEPIDLGLLSSRDLLFARLLAYRAYQQVAELFVELMAGALRRYPRSAGLDERYLDLLPEVALGVDAAGFADVATAVFAPPPPPPTVSIAHVHSSPESVAEHTAAMVAILTGAGSATFAELVAECTSTMQIVARFLGLLDLYRSRSVAFDQQEPFAPLTVRLLGAGREGGPAAVEEEG